MCFFAGGLRYSEQGFGISGLQLLGMRLMLTQLLFPGATQLNSSLMTISVIAVLLPAAFHFSANALTDAEEAKDILAVSHGVSNSSQILDYRAYQVHPGINHPSF